MDYLLDTNILVIYSRKDDLARRMEEELQLLIPDNRLAVSTVTLGELDSLAKQLNFGRRRIDRLNVLLDRMAVASIEVDGLIPLYGIIDAFSQGQVDTEVHAGVPSARNMGKNDVWIATCASYYDMTLVTTDKDFAHLEDEFIKLRYVDRAKYKSL